MTGALTPLPGTPAGKGQPHGRFAIVNVAEGTWIAAGIPGADFSFSLQEAANWLAKR
jgi:hypothetical protein